MSRIFEGLGDILNFIRKRNNIMKITGYGRDYLYFFTGKIVGFFLQLNVELH